MSTKDIKPVVKAQAPVKPEPAKPVVKPEPPKAVAEEVKPKEHPLAFLSRPNKTQHPIGQPGAEPDKCRI